MACLVPRAIASAPTSALAAGRELLVWRLLSVVADHWYRVCAEPTEGKAFSAESATPRSSTNDGAYSKPHYLMHIRLGQPFNGGALIAKNLRS